MPKYKIFYEDCEIVTYSNIAIIEAESMNAAKQKVADRKVEPHETDTDHQEYDEPDLPTLANLIHSYSENGDRGIKINSCEEIDEMVQVVKDRLEHEISELEFSLSEKRTQLTNMKE